MDKVWALAGVSLPPSSIQLASDKSCSSPTTLMNSEMRNPPSTNNPDVQTMRVELFVAEKRVKDLREQLKQAGDGAFVAQLDRERNGQSEPEGF